MTSYWNNWDKKSCSKYIYGAMLYHAYLEGSNDWEYDCKNTPAFFYHEQKWHYFDRASFCDH